MPSLAFFIEPGVHVGLPGPRLTIEEELALVEPDRPLQDPSSV